MELSKHLANGQVLNACIFRVLKVPYHELFENSADEAAVRIDEGLSRVLADFARRFPDNSFAIEILFVSTPVANQLYKAQPQIFVIIRKLASDWDAAYIAISEAAHDFGSALQKLGYSYDVLTEESASEFFSVISQIDCSSAISITRDELAFPCGNSGGFVYYNEPLPSDPVRNATLLTDALSERPYAAYSLTLMPTVYTQAEIGGVEQRRMYIDILRKQIMMVPNGSTPTRLADASKAYLDFTQKSSDLVFYYLPVVYSSSSESESLVNRLISMFSGRDNPDTHMLKAIDLSSCVGSPCENFLSKPWVLSDALVFKLRNKSFWKQKDAPTDLFRIRQIAPFSTIKLMVRLPFDDGHAVGLDANRNNTAKEKLNEAVLSERSFRIGTITDSGYSGSSDKEKTPRAGIPLKDFTKHGMIVGKSGSGKTNFIHAMLIRLAHANVPFLAIEPTKTEYRCLLDVVPDLTVFTPGMNGVSPFIINPFVPPIGVTVESYIPCLMNAFETAFTMPDPLPSIFGEVINKSYNKYGWKMSSTCEDPNATWFGFHEMIREFQNHVAMMDYESDVKGNITTAGVLRLSSLIEQNSNIYDTTQTIPIHELLKKPVVLELNAITAKEQKTLLMALLLVAICNYTKFNTAPDGELKNILLIDEAHVLFGGSSSDGEKNRAASELEDMIAEIRAYGTGVFVADQSPDTFGKSIIANTDTKIMFQTVEKGAKDILEAATDLTEGKRDLLGKLKTGECLLYYGRLPEPILIMTDDARMIAEFRREISNEELADRCGFWRDHRDLLIPFNECRGCPICKVEGCDLTIRPTTEFIASRMANFYSQYIKNETGLAAFVARKAEGVVSKELDKHGISANRFQAGYCVMVRFLRRILRSKPLNVTEAEVQRYAQQFCSFGFASAGDSEKA